MSYKFEVSYPASAGNNLYGDQKTVLNSFSQCKNCAFPSVHTDRDLHSTIYATNDPWSIANVASSLKRASPQLFINQVNRGTTPIYYHPNEYAQLSPIAKRNYIKVMEKLPQLERTLHDYLVNLYGSVPTQKEFQLPR